MMMATGFNAPLARPRRSLKVDAEFMGLALKGRPQGAQVGAMAFAAAHVAR